MTIEAADILTTVPARAKREKWNAEVAQMWARTEVLFGGPPEKPRDPTSNAPVEWSRVRDFAGRKLRIRANPEGLLITGADGRTHYFPGDTTGAGFALGTKIETIQREAAVETLVRAFAKSEVERYNKAVTTGIRRDGSRATRAFFEAGRRIRSFIEAHGDKGVNQDRVWYAIDQWGKGLGGYGREQIEYATYFYDWKKSASPDDPAFRLSETEVMILVRAEATNSERDALLAATVEGPYRGLSADQLKWALGIWQKTFPGTPDQWTSLVAARGKIIRNEPLTWDDVTAVNQLRAFRRPKANHRASKTA